MLHGGWTWDRRGWQRQQDLVAGWGIKEGEEGVTGDPKVPPFSGMAVQAGCRSKIKFGEKSDAFDSDALEMPLGQQCGKSVN